MLYKGWKDLTSSIDSHGGSSGPSWKKFRDGLYLYAFPCNSPREVMSIFHVGHDIDQSSRLYPHFHFTVNAKKSGTVRIGFEYSLAKGHAQKEGSEFGKTVTTFVHQDINENDSYKHFTAEVDDSSSIHSALIEPDTVIIMRIFRDANHEKDTYADDIFGITADIHYQADRITTKNKKPNFYG